MRAYTTQINSCRLINFVGGLQVKLEDPHKAIY